MSDRQGLAAVAERLAAAGCVAAHEEADELVAAAPDEDVLERWVRRREEGEPLAWITGRVRFCDRALLVEQGVYVPRPHSEELARRAAALLPAAGGRAVDLCTGTGAIATHLMSQGPTSTVIGVDHDPRAARCARGNGVPTVLGDLDRPLRPASFDLVTAVAPYVPTDAVRLLPRDVQRYEPRTALDGGVDGLDVVRRLVAAAARLLRSRGWLLIEVGGEQDRALEPVLAAAGFGSATSWFDEDGGLRGVMAPGNGSRPQGL